MDFKALHLICPNCAEWFTGQEHSLRPDLVFDDEGINFREHKHCPNHDELVVLDDAHEMSMQTPYDEIVCELLHEEIDILQRRIKDLEGQVTNRGGTT